MVGHSGGRYWAIKSWLPACYWVRRHGDGTFFFTSILLLHCNYLPFSPLPSPFTTTSIPSCPKHRESECASLLLLFYSCFFPFLFIFIDGTNGVRTCFFFLMNRTCIVHKESRDEIKVGGDLYAKKRVPKSSTRARNRTFYMFICHYVKITWPNMLYVIFLLLFILSV